MTPTSKQGLPVVVLAMGDPAGISPELTARLDEKHQSDKNSTSHATSIVAIDGDGSTQVLATEELLTNVGIYIQAATYSRNGSTSKT